MLAAECVTDTEAKYMLWIGRIGSHHLTKRIERDFEVGNRSGCLGEV